MAEIDWSKGQITPPPGSSSEDIDWNSGTITPPTNTSKKGFGSDVKTALKQGALEIPGMLTGLADIPLGLAGLNRPISKLAERAGAVTGFEPGKWAKDQQAEYSDATKQSRAEIDKVWDDPNTNALDVAGAYVSNPRATALNVTQSLPSMAVGGLAAKALKAAGTGLSAVTRGAIGEGSVMAGQSMDGIDDSVDPQRAAIAATGVGAGGALLGAAGGRIAQRLGLPDPDTLLAGGKANAGGAFGALPMYKRAPAAMVQEGLLEEAPQSILETGAQNWSEDKPITEGMARAATEGALAGAVMGGVVGAAPRSLTTAKDQRPPVDLATPPVVPSAEPPLQIGNTPDPYLSFPDGTVARRSEIDAFINGLPPEQQPAARAKVMGLAPQPAKPSEAMGLDPAAGPLSAAAVTAVDTGVHEGIQLQEANAADQAAYEQATNEQAQQAKQQDSIDKPITSGPIAEAAMSDEDKRAILFSNQPVLDGGIKYKGTQDGDILNGMSKPYPTRFAAQRRARMEGADWTIAQVQDGFVARRKDANGTTDAIPSGATNSAPVPATDTAGTVATGPVANAGSTADTARANTADMVPATGMPDRLPDGALNEQNPQASPIPAPVGAPGKAPQAVEGNAAAPAGLPAKGSGTLEAAGVAESFSSLDYIQGLEKDAGQGFKTNDDAISVIKKASDGMTPAAKAAVTRAINTFTAVQKNGERLIKPGFYEAIADQFTYVNYMLTDAAKQHSSTNNTPAASTKSAPSGVKEPWQMTREEAADLFPGDAYDKMLNSAAVVGNITYDDAQKRSRINSAGKREIWAKTKADLLQDKKDAIKFARGERADVNKLKSTKEFASWRIKSMSASGKEAIKSTEKYHDALMSIHKERIQEALADGKDVPAEVLADYPDLKQNASPTGNIASTEPASTGNIATAAPSIDDAAHTAATSKTNDLPQPTEAQKQAGNYPKGHVNLNGLDLSIENPAGSVRSGKDKSGKAWSNTLQHHYGYIKGTIGNDKDHVDLFVKPGTPLDYSGQVFVIDQIHPDTNRFDEHKVVVGAKNGLEARRIYQANYAKGWNGFKAMTAMPFDQFKTWVKDGPKNKPLSSEKQDSQPQGSSNEEAPKAVKTTPKQQAPAAAGVAPGVRTATEHVGVKIYPVTFKGEPRWSVQTSANKISGKVLGDTIHTTLDDAKKEAELQVARDKSQAERNAAHEAEQAAAQAKKDANKGKSLAERKRDFDLDKPTKLHPNAGLGTGTRRESMQKAVDQERHIEAATVRDEAAKKRDTEAIDRARRNNLPTGNINYPGVKEYFEAAARLKADKYEKPEYRVYDGRDNKGSFREITKTEYDYAQELKAASDVSKNAPEMNTSQQPVQKTDKYVQVEKDAPLGNQGDQIAAAEDGIVIRPGKGFIVGKFISEVDGDGVPGGPFDTEDAAREAAEAWRTKKADRATESATERARRDAMAEKIKAGTEPTAGEIKSLDLAAGESDIRWFFPTAANLFGLTSRQIRPMVSDMIRVARNDMGTKRELVPTKKALMAIGKALSNTQETPSEQPAKSDNILSIQIGGSTQTIDLGKPAWLATDAELVKAVEDSGTYLGKPGSKYDPYMAWREAQGAAIEQAVKDGKKFPDEILYDKPGLIRSDLNDNQADEAVDSMVDVYRATKDYGKAVQAYRDFGKEVAAQKPAGKFAQHNAIANEYGYTVSDDGSISTAEGKESGVKVVLKGSRFQVRSKKTDEIVYSGATVDSMGKFLESFWGAEKTAQKPAQADKPANDRDSFTLERLNKETDKMEPVTFARGEYVRYTLGGEDVFGEIDGISHAKNEFSVDGLWYPFGFAYKAEKPAAVKPPTVPLPSVIDAVNKKHGQGLTDAHRVPVDKDDKGVAMFNRANDAAGQNALQALSENDELFALPKSDKDTVEGIAAETDPGIKVTQSKFPGLVKTYVLTLPDGGKARLMVRAVNPYGPQSYGVNASEDGETSTPILERPGNNAEAVPDDTENVYIDVSALKEGKDGGKIYNIAATFAHNTGRILIGDPAGLSDAAMRRRTEHMLSSALKFGTTQHLAPHPRQVDGASGIGVSPLRWTYGDDLGNIESLVKTSLASFENAVRNPIEFDPDTGAFRDSAGRVLDEDAIQLLVKSGRSIAGRAGIATYKRSAVLRALVREESGKSSDGKQGAGILAQLVAVGRQFPAASQKIFYSRNVLNTKASNFATNEANREKTDKLQTYLKGHDLTVTPVSLPVDPAGDGAKRGDNAGAGPDSHFKLAERISGIFGKEIVWITNSGSFDINGVVVADALPNTIFVNVNAAHPAHVVLGHELTHHMEKDAPGVYKALVKSLSGLLKNHEGYRTRYNIPNMSDESVVKEMIGDLMGDNFDKREFWNRVSQESNGLQFSAIARTVMKWLTNLLNKLKLRGLGSHQFTTDVAEARDVLAKALADYAATKGKPALLNDGTVVPMFSRSISNTLNDAAKPSNAQNPHSWNAPEPSKFDDLVYKLQDKQIDTKRVIESIKLNGTLTDEKNVYLQEELFHGRAAARTEDFVNKELSPLVNMMKMRGIDIATLDEYLHARHAEEANNLIAERNPEIPDGGSGMTTQAARDYLAKLTPVEKTKFEAVAAKVDGILAATRQMYADYDLESQDKVDGWAMMFKHYVPLMREDKDGGMGIGQGFSIKGKEVKGRTGSTRKVVDILANIAMQRERAIVRGEKNRVATALVGLVKTNPNKEFWHVGPPPAQKVYDPDSNSVVERTDPLYKSRENVVMAKIKGKDGQVSEQAVTFSEDDPRAVRMAAALKNLDAAQLEGLLGVSAKITRYFAAINTQYNPVFGTVNLVRDVQGALFNLTTTPLKGKTMAIAGDTLSALKGIYLDARAQRDGKTPTSKWAQLWEEFQDEGGQTGFRDLFANSADRAKAIERELNPNAWMDSPLGKVFTADGTLKVPLAVAQKKATGVFDWLSDYNLAMENAVRLASYKAGIDQGMSKQQAASLAKNLTVNFNRKGQVGQQAGALYAFFNASMQGTARLGQTLFDIDKADIRTLRLSATGKKIVYGGVLLGVAQTVLLAAAGFDDEEPPDFVRERSMIIPTGGKTYITIPMPLGFHVLPNLGRIPAEFAMGGFKDPAKHIAKLLGLVVGTFNPIGGGDSLVQMLSPTAIDPLVAIAENKDWTGKPIAKVSFNKATPGHQLAKDTASSPAKWLAEAINYISGGTEYTAGIMSPTPDQIDYLWGQATGGVGREASKLQQTGSAMFSGEDLPIHKVPLVGRFYGDADTQSAQSGKFYSAINRLNVHEAEIKGLRKDDRGAEAARYIQENPESRLFLAANFAERDVQKLHSLKRELIAKDATTEEVKAIEARINERMTRFNQTVQRLREKNAA